MVRRCVLLFVVSLWAVSGVALEVRIVGPDGVPLVGARLTVVGRQGSVVADSDGRAEIQPEPEPPFILFVARSDGVALAPVTITAVPAEGPLEVVVQPAGETVTVVSGAVPDLELPPAVASTVLGRADLGERMPVNLPQVLENIPGAEQTGDGHSAVPGLRGLPKHRTLLLLDDGRVAAERRAGASATYLDPATIDEVEVVRGPGAVAFGSDAFGGIVRMRSRMPPPGGDGEFRYGLAFGGATEERGAAAEFTTPGLGGGVLVGAHARRYDDYTSPEGVIENSGAELYGGRVAWQGSVGGGVLRAGWRTDLARDVGKPAPDSNVKRVLYPEEDSHRLHLAFERPGPGRWQRLTGTVAWDSYRLALDKQYLAPDGRVTEVRGSDVDANDYTLRLEGERMIGVSRLVMGFDASGRYGLEALNRTTAFDGVGDPLETTTEVAIESARRDDVGLFAVVNRDVDRWVLAAGIRGDWIGARNSGGYFGDYRVSNSALSGFAAIGWRPLAGLELNAQVARGFRDALLSDRYFRGESGRGFITGNPDLEPETSRQLDLAVRWRGERWQLAAFGYLYRIDDLIERFGIGDDYFFRNRGTAEIRGVEIEGRVTLGRSLWLEIGGQVLRGEIIDDGSSTDDVPAPGVFLVLRSDPSRLWWWMVRGAAYADDDRPGPNEQVVSGYQVVDVAVGWKPAPAVELQLLGRNLTDGAHLASADVDAVLAPGRSVTLAIRGTF
jgi:outer membrane receptor protein involved in Fe transport